MTPRPGASLLCAAALASAACESAAPAAEPSPLQTLEDFALRQTTHGKLSYLLKARLAVLRENDQKAALTEPRMELYQAGKPTVRVRGRSGFADLKLGNVHLSTSVVLEMIEERSTMRTEELLFDDKRSVFYTEAPVILERPGATLRGRGFEAESRGTSARIFNQESVISKEERR